MARTVLDPADLPPRPDPMTGLPRPPHAPKSMRGSDGNSKDLATAPEPPPDQGPVLACHRPWRRMAAKLIVGIVAMFAIAIGTTVLVPSAGPIGLVPLWLVAVANVGFTVYWLRSAKRALSMAGAEWYSVNGHWVRTYELVEAELIKRPKTGKWLGLKDSGGRELQVGYELVRQNRLIWDLVYNGILYSVISGHATTNAELHDQLGLPYATP